MITNFNHLGEGRVRLTFKNGPRLAGRLLVNDRVAQVLRVEVGDGFFASVAYEELAHASVPLVQA